MDDLLPILLWAIFLGSSAVGGFLVERRRRRKNTTLKGAPILMAYYTENARLDLLKHGKMAGLNYTSWVAGATLLMRVELPFRTKLHLLGIPKDAGAVPLNPAASEGLMEEVVLEGDFPNYFSLYAEKGQQQEARYAFDPTAMEFVVDFCRSHNWEIVHDEFYFVQAMAAGRHDDPTVYWEDVDEFVEEIRPVIEDKNTPLQDKIRTPYGQERRDELKCPICSETMQKNENFFECKNHGLLIRGANLQKLRKGKIEYEFKNEEHQPRQENLTCPSCGKEMQKANYSGGKTVIDTCTNCPYRWLDSHDQIAKPIWGDEVKLQL